MWHLPSDHPGRGGSPAGAAGVAAMLEARRLRGEAREAQDHVSALLLQADMIEHIDHLEQARTPPRPRSRGYGPKAARLAKDLKRAQGREREAAGRAEDARSNFTGAAQAEEAARRTHAPAAERTDALVKMNAAASVLEGDQGALQGAAAVRVQADNDLAAARARLASLEAGLQSAQHALDNPGRPGRSPFTLTMDLARQILAGDLDPAEQAFVRSLGEALAGFSGASEDIAARAVANAERERTERYRRQPAYARPRGDGQVDVISPSLSARTAVSIFIASSVSSTSPRATLAPAAAATVVIVPGIGAPTWRVLPGSALRGGGRCATWLVSAARTERGWPFSSKNTLRVPSSWGSLTATKRTMSVLPRSSSMLISWPGCMP